MIIISLLVLVSIVIIFMYFRKGFNCMNGMCVKVDHWALYKDVDSCLSKCDSDVLTPLTPSDFPVHPLDPSMAPLTPATPLMGYECSDRCTKLTPCVKGQCKSQAECVNSCEWRCDAVEGCKLGCSGGRCFKSVAECIKLCR